MYCDSTDPKVQDFLNNLNIAQDNRWSDSAASGSESESDRVPAHSMGDIKDADAATKKAWVDRIAKVKKAITTDATIVQKTDNTDIHYLILSVYANMNDVVKALDKNGTYAFVGQCGGGADTLVYTFEGDDLKGKAVKKEALARVTTYFKEVKASLLAQNNIADGKVNLENLLSDNGFGKLVLAGGLSVLFGGVVGAGGLHFYANHKKGDATKKARKPKRSAKNRNRKRK